MAGCRVSAPDSLSHRKLSVAISNRKTQLSLLYKVKGHLMVRPIEITEVRVLGVRTDPEYSYNVTYNPFSGWLKLKLIGNMYMVDNPFFLSVLLLSDWPSFVTPKM